MLSYNPQKISVSDIEIGVSLINSSVSIDNLPSDYATQATLAEIRDVTLADANEQLQNIYTELSNNNLGVTFNNPQIQVSNIPTLTATPTYFEFTGLNVNDSAVSRLVQNSTGRDVYITQINFVSTDSSHSADYDKWQNANTCEHVLDICSSNNNYPTDTVRTFFEAERTDEQWARYNVERVTTGNFSLTSSYKLLLYKIKFDPAVLCEAGNYVRLYKNGSTTHLTSQRIAAIGYY